jgi:hypothetical protein
VNIAQAARRLDFEELCRRRDMQAESFLKRRALGVGRVEQIDPSRAFQ